MGDEVWSVSAFGHAVDELMEHLTSSIHTNSLHTVIIDIKIKLNNEFTEQEHQNIDNSGTDNKVIDLFTSLKTKSGSAYHKWLEELGHQDVAMGDKLREKINFCLAKMLAGEQKQSGLYNYSYWYP